MAWEVECEEYVPLADELYDRHLRQIETEQKRGLP